MKEIDGFVAVKCVKAKNMAEQTIANIKKSREEIKRKDIDSAIAEAAKSTWFGLKKGEIITREEAEERILDGMYTEDYSYYWDHSYNKIYELAEKIITACSISKDDSILLSLKSSQILKSWCDNGTTD
jgi:hypothetical protein